MDFNIDKIEKSVPRDENEYLAEDGLIHCRNCGGAREVIVKLFGEQKKVRCICKCMADKLEAEQEQDRKRLIEINRKECFRGSRHIHSRFETSEESEEMNIGRNYVKNFREFLDEGTGVLLFGKIGTGKSHIAACIANALIDKGFLCKMTNISTMVNELQASFEGRAGYIDNLRRYSLLIIDDLGIERNTEYMTEQLYNIIDARYTSGLPMIVTTNLSIKEMSKPANIESARIYDRILDRCHPVEIKGTSRRRAHMKHDFGRMEQLLKGE